MDDHPRVFYSYKHIHPETGECVYVGKGTGGRAWDVTRCRGQHKPHQLWMQDLMQRGYLPSDWVEITGKNLTEAEAFSLEKRTLNLSGGVRFNRQTGECQHQARITNVQAKEIFQLLWDDKPAHVVARKYGLSRTSVAMIKSKRQWATVLANETHPKYEARTRKYKHEI